MRNQEVPHQEQSKIILRVPDLPQPRHRVPLEAAPEQQAVGLQAATQKEKVNRVPVVQPAAVQPEVREAVQTGAVRAAAPQAQAQAQAHPEVQLEQVQDQVPEALAAVIPVKAHKKRTKVEVSLPVVLRAPEINNL